MRYSVDEREAKHIRTHGSYVRSGTVGIKYLPARDYHYSVVISKKQGGAVHRNRVKRSIREILRTSRFAPENGHYLVFFRGMCSGYDRNNTKTDLQTAMHTIFKKESGEQHN